MNIQFHIIDSTNRTHVIDHDTLSRDTRDIGLPEHGSEHFSSAWPDGFLAPAAKVGKRLPGRKRTSSKFSAKGEWFRFVRGRPDVIASLTSSWDGSPPRLIGVTIAGKAGWYFGSEPHEDRIEAGLLQWEVNG